jgi:hypothetical protein
VAVAVSHARGTSAVLTVNTERPSWPGVRPSWPDATQPLLDAPRIGRPVPVPGASSAAAIDGAEVGAPAYCVGDPAGRLLDAEAKQLGSASVQPFETEGLIGARTARAFTGWRRLAPWLRACHDVGDAHSSNPRFLPKLHSMPPAARTVPVICWPMRLSSRAYGRSASGDHSRVARPVKRAAAGASAQRRRRRDAGPTAPGERLKSDFTTRWYQFCICDIVSMLCMSIHGVCMFTEPAFLQRTTWPRKRRKAQKQLLRRWQRRLQRKRSSRIHD